MKKRRKVLYCESNVDGTVGGSYHSLLQLVRRLDREQYQPVVMFYTPNSLIPQFEAAGADVRVVPRMEPVRVRDWFGERSYLTLGLLPLQRVINIGRRLVLQALWRARFIKREGIELVHLNNSVHINHDWMLAARLVGVPCVTHQRGMLTEAGGFNGMLQRSTRRRAKRLSAVIAISQAVAENLRRFGIDYPNVELIYNGVDPQVLQIEKSSSELRQEHAIPEQAPVIGVLGNIKHWKGQETAIRATAELKARHPQIRCLIIGDVGSAEYDDYLRELVRELAVEEHVLFTGFKKNVADYINLLDVVLHTSTDPEPFGRVLLEGMLLERPVVATDIGGPREIIEPELSGFLVPPADPHALSAVVGLLIEDPARRQAVGRAARARVLKEFTIQRNVERTEALYARIFSRAQDAAGVAVADEH